MKMKRALFVHQNFPGQFKHIAPELRRIGWDVKALRAGPTPGHHWQGIHQVGWTTNRGTTSTALPYVHDFETKLIRAEAAARTAEQLKLAGWRPDVIIGHPGWGELLFLSTIWPDSPQLHYLEFNYSESGLDVGFDPEFSKPSWEEQARVIAKMANSTINLERMTQGLSPTQFQASTYPKWAQSKIHVIHDGIDTNQLTKNPKATFCPAPGAPTWSKGDLVLTFVSRNLEPYRGYHRFMRALPELQRAFPELQTVIVGGDGVSYGAAAPKGQRWKDIFLNEVKSELDLSRLWMTGNLDYKRYIALLQVSACHVYLTYPFVLSWSCVEAMSMECPIVGSATAPVMEVIEDGKTGLLVDFFSQNELVHAVKCMISNTERAKEIGKEARMVARQRFDLHQVCLPKLRQLIDSTAH